MLSDANLPKVLWGKAAMIATYIQNRVPTSAIDSYRTPLNFGLVKNLTYHILGYLDVELLL